MNVLQHQRLKKKNKKKKQKKDVKENAQKKTTEKKECFKLQWLMAATDWNFRAFLRHFSRVA